MMNTRAVQGLVEHRVQDRPCVNILFHPICDGIALSVQSRQIGARVIVDPIEFYIRIISRNLTYRTFDTTSLPALELRIYIDYCNRTITDTILPVLFNYY
ncbi:hypothetical protein CBL_13430 [Carabus blaptoides fortunei]